MHYFSFATPHRSVSSKHLFYFNTAISDSREQNADRIFRPFSRRMFETFVVDVCVFERIQWEVLVVKFVAYSGCLYFKIAYTKIVRSSNVDYCEDGNSKLLRNIGHIPADWKHLHRHCCENLRCLTVSSFHRAEQYSLLKSREVGGKVWTITSSQGGGLCCNWLLKRTGRTRQKCWICEPDVFFVSR